MKEVIVNNKIIYEVDDNGQVIKDERVKSALLDGHLNMLDSYYLNAAEKRAVIKALKEHNAVNSGLTTDQAEEETNKIKATPGFRNPGAKSANLVELNGVVEYSTDPNGNVIKDNRVKDATTELVIRLSQLNSDLSFLDNYDLTQKQKDTIMSNIRAYLNNNPIDTEEGKRKFINNTNNIISKINEQLNIPHPQQINVKTGEETNTADQNRGPSTGIANYDKAMNAITEAIINKGDLKDVFKQYSIPYDKQSTILNYFNKYIKVNDPVKKKDRFIKFLPDLYKYIKHDLEGHPDDLTNAEAFREVYDGSGTNELFNTIINAKLRGEDPVDKVRGLDYPSNVKRKALEIMNNFLKNHKFKSENDAVKYRDFYLPLLKRKLIYEVNGIAMPHGNISKKERNKLLRETSDDYSISIILGEDPALALNRHKLTSDEKYLVQKHYDKYLANNQIVGDKTLLKFLNDVPKITEAIIKDDNAPIDPHPTKKMLIKNLDKYMGIYAGDIANNKDPYDDLFAENLTKDQIKLIGKYIDEVNKNRPLTKTENSNYLIKHFNHVKMNTMHNINGKPDDISNDPVYMPPKKDYSTYSSRIKIGLNIALGKEYFPNNPNAQDIHKIGLPENVIKIIEDLAKEWHKTHPTANNKTMDGIENSMDGLVKQVLFEVNKTTVPHPEYTQNEYRKYLKKSFSDSGFRLEHKLDAGKSLNRHGLTDHEKLVYGKHINKIYDYLKSKNIPADSDRGMDYIKKEYPKAEAAAIEELLKSKFKNINDKKKLTKDFNNKINIPDNHTPSSSNNNVELNNKIKKKNDEYAHKYGNKVIKKRNIKIKPSEEFVTKEINAPVKEAYFLEPRNEYNVRNDDIGVKDSDWVTNVFMLGKKDLDVVVKDVMFWTSAEMKVVDTSLGGNYTVNNLPQFTRTADIRVMGHREDRQPVKIESVTGNHGMGRYYSEKIDDNSVKCYLSFGVPEFNGIFTYLTSAVNYQSAVVANSGRSPLAYKAGHLVGSFAFFAAFPIASLVYWVGSEIMDLVLGPGNFEFYYLKETMPKYWSIVNSLVMMMSTELGLVMPTFNTKKSSGTIGAPLKLSKEDMAYFHMFMPEAITEKGYLNIMAVITKTQRAVNKYLKEQYSTIKTNNSISNLKELQTEVAKQKFKKPTPYHKYWDDVKEKYDGPLYGKTPKKKKNTNTDTGTNTKTSGKDTKKSNQTVKGLVKEKAAKFVQNTKKWKDNFIAAETASIDGGADSLILNVEYVGSSSMSVSNETGELEISGMLKGIGGKARAIRYSGAEGILGAVGDIAKYATDAAVGAIDGMTLNIPGKILTLLLGEANLALPKRWMDSSISVPTHTFKMKLVSPYGNPMSQLINIYIPLATIMAGALPLATGMSSYTSPFLCNMFVRGYQFIPMGMITSLEITKGTSNLPFNQSWKPMAVDVSFTVTDFSQVLALPVGQDLTSMANVIYDNNNPLNRYIQALCGRDFHTTTFVVPKLKMRVNRLIDNIDVMLKPETAGMEIGGLLRPLGRLSPFHQEAGEYYNNIY